MMVGLLALFFGVFSWTFTEYAMHNWWGHLPKGKNHFSKQHLTHHAKPHWFAPTREKVWAATKATIVLLPIALLVAGPVIAITFVIGFVGMYGGYELVHRRAHTHAPRGPYARWTRKHHFLHHFSSPKMNHGVTSPIWDLVFRTYKRPGVVRVPRRHAMVWLVDSDGEILPKYKGDYLLVGRKKRTKTRDTDRMDVSAAFENRAPKSDADAAELRATSPAPASQPAVVNP